jgi:hypothetical protein
MLLPQDIFILLKLCCLNDSWTFRTLSEQIFLSLSQIHSGLKRAEAVGLFSSERRRPVRPKLEELLVHGVKYVYAVQPGAPSVGMPTSYAAAPLNSIIVASGAPPPVWPFPEGTVIGYTIEPLHPAAPRAAMLDSKFYELLCLVDAIREGRARERELAERQIHERMRK